MFLQGFTLMYKRISW